MAFPRVSLGWLIGAVAVLATVVFVVSLASLGRLIRLSTEQRLERGRELVERELDHLVATADVADGPLRLTVLGMRGGVVPPGTSGPSGRTGQTDRAVRTGLTSEADVALGTLIATAPRDRAQIGSLPVEEGTVFLATQARDDGHVVWTVYTVQTPRHLATWRTTVAVLTLATALLGMCAVAAVVGTRRGARSLERAIVALEDDLTAPVPRPAVAELARIADRVESMARHLEEAQRAREQLVEELAQREHLAALGRVVAGVAHEVRNPLASMKLRIDLARTSESVPPAVIRDLDEVSQEIERLDRLVTDFLLVSGRKTKRSKACDLGALARARVAQLSPWAGDRGVRIDVQGTAEIQVDADACARVVDNLVRNAVEASSPGDDVRVAIEDRGAHVALVVEDTGPGVAPDLVPRLFEPFFTTKVDGTGLGLAVSRALASASGGRLEYHREPGRTRFELSLAELPAVDAGAPS